MNYIDRHQHQFGVEPICQALTNTKGKIAPSTYYAATKRPPSARAIHNEHLTAEITRVHQHNQSDRQ